MLLTPTSFGPGSYSTAPPRRVPAAAVPIAPGSGLGAAAFVPNRGQWRHDARLAAQLGAAGMFLDSGGWTLTLEEPIPAADDGAETPVTGPQPTEVRGVAVRMSFAGAEGARLVPERPLPGVHHYLLGDDPAGWRTDVPRFASVRYEGVRPGVDVRMREHAGHFEYDLLLASDARLDEVAIDVRGIERLYVAEDGALVLETALGPVRMPLPVSWEQGTDGITRAIDCHYVVLGPGRFGFEAPAREPGWALVVDPGLVWGTYFGGSGDEGVNEIEVGPTGEVTILGWTRSDDLPGTPGAYQTTRASPGTGIGTEDYFVARLSADGSTLLWCTYVGGDATDWADGLQVDSGGVCTLTGYTSSTNYPTTAGVHQPDPRGEGDAFVTRLAADGQSLIWSTRLGGSGGDAAFAVAVDAQGVATVAGKSKSTDFPATRGSVGGKGGDTFVCQLDADGGGLRWSTVIGGSKYESAAGLAVDLQGTSVAIAGVTWSEDFPTTPNAFQRSDAGGESDRFVARLEMATGQILHATLLGGSGRDGAIAGRVAFDAQGNLTVAGYTDSTDFPTTPGAFDTTANGGADAFVARLDPTLSTLVWSTYLGGRGTDRVRALHGDALGIVTVGGNAVDSDDYPVTAGAFRTPAGSAGLSRLSADGAEASDLLTTQGAFQRRASPGHEGYVMRLDLRR